MFQKKMRLGPILVLVLLRTRPVMKPVTPPGCAVRLLASSEQSNEPIVLGPNVSSDLLRAPYRSRRRLPLLPYKQSDEHSAARIAATPNRPIGGPTRRQGDVRGQKGE
jgi:hypothetical protein